MNKQRLYLDQLRHELTLEEFKLWDASRNEADKNYLEDIQQNIQQIRSLIKETCTKLQF